MKSRQTWIVVGTAVVSFALGLAVAPSRSGSDTGKASGIQQAGSGGKGRPTGSGEESLEAGIRTRAGKREAVKDTAGPRLSIPLSTVSQIIREAQQGTGFGSLRRGMDKSLELLGATGEEKEQIQNHLADLEARTWEEEKKHLQVLQTDQTRIRLDSSAMEPFAKDLVRDAHEGIRSRLPRDMAEVLISSMDWDKLYPMGENAYPTFTITRSTSGRMMAWVHQGGGGNGTYVDPKFADDGTPIPADEVFHGDRWKPFLRGLTLLPQNEK